MRRIWKWSILIVTILFAGLMLWGCGEVKKPKKLRDLDFTVLAPEQIPAALTEVIDENKATEMKLSYQKEGFLYIARGFGEQTTGGYSIAVDECCLSEDGIHVTFRLIGPASDAKMKEEVSYPYVVIKLEAIDGTIQFD
ncbi:MAG: protease complex subunit PrcB family protein [Eubacteriales bacterium]|nr:protease complex subunit PrcB family protein [Eubacteriales bacterium]